MDVFDQATVQEEKAREMALKLARDKQPQLTSCGVCHNCAEPVNSGLLFCDANCRDDWQKRNPAPRG